MTCFLFSALCFEDYFKACFQEYWLAGKIVLHLQMWLPNFRHSLAKINPIAYMVCLLNNLVLELWLLLLKTLILLSGLITWPPVWQGVKVLLFVLLLILINIYLNQFGLTLLAKMYPSRLWLSFNSGFAGMLVRP